MVELCNIQEFLNIKLRALRMINKYSIIYEINKEKYDIIMDLLMSKRDEIISKTSLEFSNDENLKTGKSL